MLRITYSSFVKSTFVIALAIASCTDNDTDDDGQPEGCPTPVSYSGTIVGIVEMKCALDGCHDGSLGDERNWTNYEKLKAKSAEVKFRVENNIMPPSGSPGGPLSEAQKDSISCWVRAGALNN